jgi:hypothetical protein
VVYGCQSGHDVAHRGPDDWRHLRFVHFGTVLGQGRNHARSLWEAALYALAHRVLLVPVALCAATDLAIGQRVPVLRKKTVRCRFALILILQPSPVNTRGAAHPEQISEESTVRVNQAESWANWLEAVTKLIGHRFSLSEPRQRAVAYVRGLLSPVLRQNSSQ